ncbi:unnamed protein product [Penicillium pancosmium]
MPISIPSNVILPKKPPPAPCKQPTNVTLRTRADQASRPGQQAQNFGVNASDIKLDLTAGKGRPEWIFSAYSPQRDVPRQLFGGAQREQSMEEMRLRHYEAVAAGNMNQAVQEAEALWNESAQQMDAALSDLDGAVNYIVSGANEHPNRIDIVEGKTGQESNQGSAFGQPAAPAQASNAFGQPSQPSTSAFGQPAFGQPSQPTGQASAFGAPSTLGQSSPFGQASQSSAFGQPSSLGAGSAFGQPSGLGAQPGLGKPSFGQSGFSQSATSAFGGSAFGQPSAPAPAAPFGAPSANSPFTQVGQNQSTGGFGQPSGQQAQAPAPFGQPSQPQASPFGQPSAPAPATTFGQPSQPNPSPFGQPQQQQASPFGLASSAASNPFGGSASTQPNPSPFGQPAAPQGVPVAQPAAGPRAAIKIDNTSTLDPFPPLQGETRRDPTSKILTMWKGRPVRPVKVEDGTVRPAYLHPQDNKTLVRVMFPDGPPDDAGLRDALSTPEQMTPEIEEMYNFFAQNGYFKDGVIPPIPPKKDAVSFDF